MPPPQVGGGGISRSYLRCGQICDLAVFIVGSLPCRNAKLLARAIAYAYEARIQ